MVVSVFAKKRSTKEGKTFYTYFGKLTKVTGEEITVDVRFRESCGQPDPKNCPMNLVLNKTDANYSEKEVEYTDNDGLDKTAVRRTLWVSAWTEGEPYTDTSMDAFVD